MSKMGFCQITGSEVRIFVRLTKLCREKNQITDSQYFDSWRLREISGDSPKSGNLELGRGKREGGEGAGDMKRASVFGGIGMTLKPSNSDFICRPEKAIFYIVSLFISRRNLKIFLKDFRMSPKVVIKSCMDLDNI